MSVIKQNEQTFDISGDKWWVYIITSSWKKQTLCSTEDSLITIKDKLLLIITHEIMYKPITQSISFLTEVFCH